MKQKHSWGTLAGWGALIGGIAALITAFSGFWDKDKDPKNVPSVPKSPTPAVNTPELPDTGHGSSPPASSQGKDPNAVVVDPSTIVQQKKDTYLAAKDFYEGKRILVRYDLKANADTIAICDSSKGESSNRCIKAILKTRQELGNDIFIKCQFNESYNSYLQGINREIFASQKLYTLTLEGQLKDISEIKEAFWYVGGDTAISAWGFSLQNCQVSNINRSGQ